MRDRPG